MDRSRPIRALVVSASMGAGHDGAARELAARLNGQGHQAEVRDFLDAAPLRLGAALRGGYEFELKHVPSAYDATYRLWYRVPWLCPARSPGSCRCSPGAGSCAGSSEAATPTSSCRPIRWRPCASGRLRQTGRLAVPAVNFITDFGVHPLWVHRGIDVNLAVHRTAGRGGRPAHRPAGCGLRAGRVARPSTPPASRPPSATRPAGQFGLDPTTGRPRRGRVVGRRRLEGRPSGAIAGDGRFVPVVVCGQRRGVAAPRDPPGCDPPGRSDHRLGWTDQMPALMAACDALVENAGGLTSLEALRAGLPIVSYQPIAGHGKENTAAMAAAGVSRMAAGVPELIGALDALTVPGPARDVQIAAGRAMFASDGAAHVVGAARDLPLAAPVPWRRPVGLVARAAVAAVALLGLVWTGLTTGVGVAAAEGAGVARPAPGAGEVTYLGVRLTEEQMADPVIANQLASLDATAVVDARTAEADPAALEHLAALGLDVENGGRGVWTDAQGTPIPAALWTRAERDVAAANEIGALTGEPVTFFVPGRRLNVWDLVDSHKAHRSVVVPNTTFVAAHLSGAESVRPLAPHRIYLIDGLGASAARLQTVLTSVGKQLGSAGLPAVPLDALR